MKLFHAAPSYYSMIARLALAEAGLAHASRLLDIHVAKDQLSPWYRALNPAMTVPTLQTDAGLLTDSRDILAFCAEQAGEAWADADAALRPAIAAAIEGHYAISIEQLTFGKAMLRIPPLRFGFPRLLRKAIRGLQQDAATAADPAAIQRKIALNQARLDYFASGDLAVKLEAEKAAVARYLASLPPPSPLLFGARVSSADIVAAVLAARLQMIGEGALLVRQPGLSAWFALVQARPAFAAADIWTRFHPGRIITGVLWRRFRPS